MRTAAIAFALLALGGCAKVAAGPIHFESYCKAGTKADVTALRRIAASVLDGTQYKSPSGPFTARPLRYLEQYGGAVGTWNPKDFDLPITIAENRKRGFEPFALAVPDDGGVHDVRIVFLAFRFINSPYLQVWVPESSSDRENSCK
jgi:hypothetical protein